MSETISTFNDIQRAIYTECYDRDLAYGTATVAAPDGFVHLSATQREPIESAIVPAVTAVLLDGSGRVTHGTTTFGVVERSIPACMEISSMWLDATGKAARSGKLIDVGATEDYRRRVYYGAQSQGTCLLGGLALVRNKTGENGGLDYVQFVSTQLYDHIGDTHDTRTGRIAVKAGLALRRMKTGEKKGEQIDPVLLQAADFLKMAVRDAKQRPTSPAIVAKPLILTI